MDILIKKYFDYYRLRGQLPPELRGQVGAAELFPDIEALDRWRSWRTGMVYEDETTGAVLSGAIDDLMVEGGKYIPTDYKTRGFDIKEGGEHYYQNQLNLYALLLQKNNLPPTDFAWLIYWIPRSITPSKENLSPNLFSNISSKERMETQVKFSVELKKVKTDTNKALEVFRAAAKLLEGPMPQPNSGCPYCSWGAGYELEPLSD